MLITVMSERELHVPRLGRVVADPGFRLVAAMNPFDAVGTARISSAVYDRVCRLSVDYQIGRRGGGDRRAGRADGADAGVGRARSSSWCGAPAPIPTCASARRCAARSTPPPSCASLADAARAAGRRRRRSASMPCSMALSGRVRLREGCLRTAEEIITELWDEIFGVTAPARRRRRRRREKRRPRRGPPLPEGGPAGRRGHRRRQALDGRRRRELARHAELRPGLARGRPARRGGVRRGDGRGRRRGDGAARRHDAGDRRRAARAGPAPGRPAGARRRPPRPGPAARQRAHRRPRRTSPTPVTSTSTPASRRSSRPAPPGAAVDPERLRVRRWVQPRTAVCLLVDRSGSMGGKPLATNAVAAAAVAFRAPGRLQRRVVRQGLGRRQVAGRPDAGRDRRRRRARRCAATARPTSPARSRPPASSWPGRTPGARSRAAVGLPGHRAGRRRRRRRRARRAGDRRPRGRRRGRRASWPTPSARRSRRSPARPPPPTPSPASWPDRRARRPDSPELAPAHGARASGRSSRRDQQVTSRGGTMPNVFSAGPSSAGAVVAGGRRRRRPSSPVRGGGRRRRRWRRLEDLLGRVGERRLAAEDRQHRLHVVAVDPRLEHVGAADRRGRRPRSGTSGCASGSTSRSTPANSSILAGDSSVSVTTSPLVAALDQAAGDARVEQALGEHARPACGAGSPAGGRCARGPRSGRLPVAAARRVLVLVVARAHVGEGVVAVEREAARPSAR